MTAAPTLRDARAADVAAVVAIERHSFGDPWSEGSFRALLTAPQARFRVAERDGALLGYCVAWHIADEAELANVAVAPEARRQGIGALLLDDLLAVADQPPGQTVYLEVRERNLAAQALYRSRGFEASGRRRAYYSNPTEDALVMRRVPRVLRAPASDLRP
jgi:ribosomal-protein-alanine N-acetyltransferase